MNRREFISRTATHTAMGATLLNPIKHVTASELKKNEIKAVAFDAFPIFDPRPIFQLVASIYPDHPQIAKNWFSKIFSYTWLRTCANQYKRFDEIIEDALVFTIQQNNVKLSNKDKNELINVWLKLELWPDALSTIKQLRNNNIKVAFLSNFTEKMLRTNAHNGGVESDFEYFSTDLAYAFKPDPRAYQLATEGFSLPKENIAFCAFAAWDVAGANWFGFPTIWINRLGQSEENLNSRAMITGKNLTSLIDYISIKA